MKPCPHAPYTPLILVIEFRGSIVFITVINELLRNSSKKSGSQCHVRFQKSESLGSVDGPTRFVKCLGRIAVTGS